MQYLSRFILAGILISVSHFLYAQKKGERPFHERPDIKISHLNISPQSLRAGQDINIEVTVTNQSIVASGNFELLIVADNQIIGKQQVNIDAMSSKKIDFKWTITKNEEFYIKAIADPNAVLDETDRSDNILELKISAGHINVIRLKPQKDSMLPKTTDLLIEDISIQGHHFQENKTRMVTINFRVTNQSPIEINKSFRTQVNITAEAGFKKEFSIKTEKISAGQSAYISYTLQHAPHRFDISIKTDADNIIAESNEENNSAQASYENPAPPVNRWVSAGPDVVNGVNNVGYPWSSVTGLLSAMAINPISTQTMYVGSPRCGIWKTIDGASSWFPLTDKISLSVSAITLDPLNAERIYWLTANEGVYRSDDGGMSWIQTSNQDLNAIVPRGKLLIHPRDPNILVATSVNGVYRSGDGGSIWNLVLPGGVCSGLAINRASDILYAAISSNTNNMVAGVYASYDRGLNWQKLTGCPGGSLPTNNLNNNILIAQSGSTVYAAFRTASLFQLYRTTNIGCSIGGRQEAMWERAWSTTTNAGELWGQLYANPFDENSLYLGGTAFWRSTNKGSNFTKVSDYGTPSGSAHADHHGFAVMPQQGNIIFSLNDGGIYRSNQNGNLGSWIFIGKGIYNVLFYDFADAFTKQQLLLGGTQDNGTIKTDGNLSWKASRDGDGATVDIDNSNENIMYSMNQYASSIARSTNGGGNWSNMSAGLPTGSVCFNLTYHLHPKNMNILLAPCNSLWRIINPGGSWQVIFTPTLGVVSCSSVEPSSDVYLAGTSFGALFGGVGGNNFQQLFSHPSFMGIVDIECDLDNSSNIYLGCAGLTTGRVYLLKKSQSGNSYTAIDITGDLPTGANVQCIAVDRMNPYTIYVGAVNGVYKGISNNQGQTWKWSPYMDGMPLADVRDLEVHPVSGVLRAATFGRSLFEVSTNDPIGSLLAVTGKINFLRVHDVGTKFGPPNDVLDAECIVQLDTKPGHYFGLKLRTDGTEASNVSSLKLLRAAFESNLQVRIEYIKNGLHSGRIIRVIL
jgi:photosystem II stability/assembly factor-like uncharacterized protein